MLRYTYSACLFVPGGGGGSGGGGGGGGGGGCARVMFKDFTDFIFAKEKEN